jgi:hypothetical protein
LTPVADFRDGRFLLGPTVTDLIATFAVRGNLAHLALFL